MLPNALSRAALLGSSTQPEHNERVQVVYVPQPCQYSVMFYFTADCRILTYCASLFSGAASRISEFDIMVTATA